MYLEVQWKTNKHYSEIFYLHFNYVLDMVSDKMSYFNKYIQLYKKFHCFNMSN